MQKKKILTKCVINLQLCKVQHVPLSDTACIYIFRYSHNSRCYDDGIFQSFYFRVISNCCYCSENVPAFIFSTNRKRECRSQAISRIYIYILLQTETHVMQRSLLNTLFPCPSFNPIMQLSLRHIDIAKP